jgi:peroxiredoxin
MSTRLTAALLVPALAGLLVALGGCEPPAVEGKQVGNLCPDIAGEDPDGKVIRLSEFRGKVVLVNFWGTWCGPCRQLIPLEQEMVGRKYKDRPFVLFGVAQDSAETVKEFQKVFPMPWPNIVDERRLLSGQWNVLGFPACVLVDHRGIVRKRWLEGINPQEVWEEVELLVKKAEASQ